MSFIFHFKTKSLPKPLFPISLPNTAVCSESWTMCKSHSNFKFAGSYNGLLLSYYIKAFYACCSSQPRIGA